MRRFTVMARLASALIIATTLAACGSDSSSPDAAALTNEPFFISGAITSTDHPFGYIVSGTPGTGYQIDRAAFRLTAKTEIRRTDGSQASASDLTVGRQISLWIDGAIAESYPVQVGAKLIVMR